MGFLLRWGMIGVGCFMLVGGINEAFNGTRVNTEAKPMSPTELASLASGPQTLYAQVSGTLDIESAVYETGLREPSLTTVPTDTVYDLPQPMSPQWSEARSLQGSVVTYNGSLLPMRVIVEEVYVENGESMDEGETRAVRCIATVNAGPGQLFIISPRFQSENDPKYQTWINASRFWGKVCRMDSLDRNLSIERPVEEILNLYRENGVPASSHTLALIAYEGQATPFNGAAYAPLQGTGNQVLVRFHAQDRDALGSTFDGITEPSLASYLSGADRLISDLPDRIVLLDTSRSGTDVNNKTAFAALFGCISGLVLLALGGGWVFALRVQRKRQERFAQKQLELMLAAKYGVKTPSQDDQRYAA